MTAVHVFNNLTETRERSTGRAAVPDMGGNSPKFLLDTADSTPRDFATGEVPTPDIRPDLVPSDEMELAPEHADSLELAPEDAAIAAGGDPLTRILEGWTGLSAGAHTSGTLPDDSVHPPIATITKAGAIPDSVQHPLASGLAPAAGADDATLFTSMEEAAESENTLLAASVRGETSTSISAAVTRHTPSSFQAATQQVAEALIRMKGDRLEIALSPEELGQLRIVLSHKDGMAHLLVWAERPEIMELMRRNASMLQGHFAEAGTDLAFMEFSSGSEHSETVAEGDRTASEEHEHILQVPLAAKNPDNGSGKHRVDIRL